MSLKPLLSFSTGELDPVMHDLVTLEKFNKGLETARNVMIGKTGSIISRFSRAHFAKSKNNGEAIKLFRPPGSSILTEWGPLYVRGYTFSGTVLYTTTHSFTAADLEIIHFSSNTDSIYAFVKGKNPIKLDYTVGTYDTLMFQIPFQPTNISVTPTGTPSGYTVDYAVTPIWNGQEGEVIEWVNSGNKLPVVSGQYNTITVAPDLVNGPFNGIKVYRRPSGGGAYGFIGESNYVTTVNTFIDHGGTADYTQQPPEIITTLGMSGSDIADLDPATGTFYQQRLLLGNLDGDVEAIIASRPGYENNFYRDHPYSNDSALKFKAGTTGRAEVLRMIDNDGLIVFTGAGIYINTGPLTIDNVALENKGKWIINEKIPPLAVPGGVFFVDKATNTIRQFVYSDKIATYQALDFSIFSDHLFRERTVVSWAFQSGAVPVIIAVFSDGTFATFTYQAEQMMQAWTRHDSVYPIEQVEGTDSADSTFFVVNKGGNRYIEYSLPRFVPSGTFVSNPEADKLSLNAFVDGAKTLSGYLNGSLTGGSIFVLTPVTAGEWEEDLVLTCGTSALFPNPGLGAVGTIFRFFDTTDKSVVDLEVMSRTSNNQVTVRPSCLFPSAQASGFRLYQTYNQVTGLTHLEGESVSVFVDGYVVASPNNDQENFPTVTVTSGTITLPNSIRGAIIVVGRPITADIKTLNVSTVEQSPTMLESLNINKLYMRVRNTRGLYVDNVFPEEKDGEKDGHTVEGMEDLDYYYVPDGYNLTGNRYKEGLSKRLEVPLKGSWSSQGRISIRQVDPLHFEILSIIPDMTILNRSDR